MKAIFLDRDGVINVERGEYTYRLDDFEILPDTIPVLQQLKSRGYLLIIITNQAGIAKGLYTSEDVLLCHEFLQGESGHIFDALYYCPWHPDFSISLARKPDTLLFERAIARFGVVPEKSFMIGDRERDLIPARKMGMKTILLGMAECEFADYQVQSISATLGYIL